MFDVYFGAPGSGKSTMACRLARQALKKGIKVFSNVEIKGCLELDPTPRPTMGREQNARRIGELLIVVPTVATQPTAAVNQLVTAVIKSAIANSVSRSIPFFHLTF